MIQDFPRRAELLELLGLLRDGEVTAEQIVLIEEIVRGDERAMAVYVQYVYLGIALHYRVGKASGASAASSALPICPLPPHAFPPALGSPCAGPHVLDSSSAGVPPPPAPRAGVLRVLGDLGRKGRGFAANHIAFSALAAMVFVTALVTLAAWNGGQGAGSREPRAVANRRAEGGSEIADHKSEISNPKFEISNPSSRLAGHPLGGSLLPASVSPLPASPARLVRVKDCHWNGHAPSPHIGQSLPIGQPLNLASGVAEIDFDIGAKVILQSPAAFELLSANSARLQMGKATVEIKNERARGFKILTPEATFVDQGTEFGVEVAPGGSSKVHVFKGLVDVDRKAQGGRDAPLTQRLAASVGARMEPGEQGMALVQDTGECFIRSMDEADRDRHTVAYWRFEDRPLGSSLPHTSENKNPIRATTDSTFNGNDLFTYHSSAQLVISGDVPAGTVPQTGAENRGCVENTIYRGDSARTDLYTKSRFSHAAPLDIQQITPAQWTIEVSVNSTSLRGKVQTFVGRDGCDHDPSRGPTLPPARLAFQITVGNRFAIRFVDCDNRVHQAIAEQLPLGTRRWYNLAATSDGQTLRLYADLNDGQGYLLQAESALPKTGSTALSRGNSDAQWSVGRGCDRATGWPGEYFEGRIDEVRISDIARDPSEFLFTSNEHAD